MSLAASTEASIIRPKPEPAIKRGPCSKCGADSELLQKQNRRLREKLEYSELQNLKLLWECDRLRKELREALFRGRSSVSRPPCPALPNELLQEIFSLATRVDGDLVSPYWRIEEPYIPWVISSQARRSIPLVCRQWYGVGSQYLYEHVVIFDHFQLSRFVRGLNTERLNWIRGLEFIFLKDSMSTANQLTAETRLLIRRLPLGRLRVFGFEHGECSTDRNAMEIVADGLEASGGSLESLHMPCLREPTQKPIAPPPPPQQPSVPSPQASGPTGQAPDSSQPDTQPNDPPEPDIDDPAAKEAGFTGFSRLKVLSLTRGRWESCGGTKRATQDMISALANTDHLIHTVHLNWMRGAYASNYLTFLRTASCLQTIHIIVGRTPLLEDDLDEFLEAVPQLRRLVITPSDNSDRHIKVLRRDAFTHQSLEEIILEMHFAFSFRRILTLNPLFEKIQSGRLPRMKRVIICGPYREGCIDSRLVLPIKFADCWNAAITACADHGIAFEDELGNAVHLWSSRHGIAFGSDEEDTDSDGSLGGEWWEMNGSGYHGSSISDDSIISDDSDDSPYRYASHPDLDYDTDLDSY